MPGAATGSRVVTPPRRHRCPCPSSSGSRTQELWWSLQWVLASLLAGRSSWEDPDGGLRLSQQ